jgi:hypothetical protein
MKTNEQSKRQITLWHIPKSNPRATNINGTKWLLRKCEAKWKKVGCRKFTFVQLIYNKKGKKFMCARILCTVRDTDRYIDNTHIYMI